MTKEQIKIKEDKICYFCGNYIWPGYSQYSELDGKKIFFHAECRRDIDIKIDTQK